MDHKQFTADMERIKVASSNAAARLARAQTTAEWDDAYREVADTDRQLLALGWGLLNRIGIPRPPNVSKPLRSNEDGSAWEQEQAVRVCRDASQHEVESYGIGDGTSRRAADSAHVHNVTYLAEYRRRLSMDAGPG